MTNIYKVATSTGCTSVKEFAGTAGVARPALYKSFNEYPYAFNRHFTAVKYLNLRRNLKKAKAKLKTAQDEFDKVKKYEHEVVER